MKNSLNKILALAIIISLCFGFINLPITGEDYRNIDMSNWMGELYSTIGEKPLHEIAMPGTHDSPMYKGMGDGDAAKNQNKSFSGQLNAGARAFDFRFGYAWDECAAFPGSFSDPRLDSKNDGPQCWTCPSGYERTLEGITSSKACIKKGGTKYAKAKKHGKGTGIFGTDCPGGQFWDPNSYCWSCPDGYSRTAHPVTSGKACSKKVRDQFAKANYEGPFLTPYNSGNLLYSKVVPWAIGKTNELTGLGLTTPAAVKTTIVMCTGNFMRKPDYYMAGHERMFIDYTLRETLQEIRRWIKSHPGETIILRLWDYDMRGKRNTYYDQFKTYLGEDVIYKTSNSKNPAEVLQKNVRGKVILLHDQPENDLMWNYKNDWYTEGGYRGSGDGNVTNYKNYLNSVVDATQGQNSLYFFKTCLTPYGTNSSGSQDPYSLAKKWHPTLEQLITNDWKYKQLNIVAIDFIGNFNGIAKHVVLSNLPVNER